MRIRFLNTFEPVTSLYRDLLPALVQAGHTVEVYLSRCEYRQGRTPLADALPRHGVRIVRLPALGRYATSRWRKLAAAGLFGLLAAVRTLFGRRADLNIFLTQPPLFASFGLVLKALRGQPYECLLMDIYPDVVVESGLLSAGAPVTRALRWLARLTWRNAAGVIVIGRCMRDLVIAAGVDPARVHVVTNWSNETAIVPVPHAENPLRDQLGIDLDDLVVVYSGNMGVAHNFDAILHAAQALLDLAELKFVFLGGGARRAEIEQAVAAAGLTNVRLLPSQPEDSLRYSQSLGDVHFISLRAAFTGLMVPSKAYGALAAGRAILYQGRADGEIARLIVERDIGRVVAEHDAEGLTLALRRYCEDRALVRAQGERARQVAQTQASVRHAIQGYLAVLDGAAGPRDEVAPSSG